MKNAVHTFYRKVKDMKVGWNIIEAMYQSKMQWEEINMINYLPTCVLAEMCDYLDYLTLIKQKN